VWEITKGKGESTKRRKKKPAQKPRPGASLFKRRPNRNPVMAVENSERYNMEESLKPRSLKKSMRREK
jgi:hypothetical protein